jgi:hypothetical protein
MRVAGAWLAAMAGRGNIMVTTFSRTFAHSAIVLATVVILTPTTTGLSAPGGVQVAGVMPPGAQVIATILEDHNATLAFQRTVAGYASMHRLLEGPLPTLEVSTDMRVVQAAIDALATQIEAARKGARQGDIFTDSVARMFRRRIATCLSPEDLEAILAENRPEYEEPEGFAAPRLQVNGVWPPQIPFGFVPPQLLAALPALPPELQYRIAGRSLVLWDHHANLVVDFLPGALTT